MEKVNRAKCIDEIIRIAYDSLETHLSWTYSKGKPRTGGNIKFHQLCVKGYARQILLASKLY